MIIGQVELDTSSEKSDKHLTRTMTSPHNKPVDFLGCLCLLLLFVFEEIM